MSEIGLNKEQLDTPVLWVDLNSMEQNIQNDVVEVVWEIAGRGKLQ